MNEDSEKSADTAEVLPRIWIAILILQLPLWAIAAGLAFLAAK